MPRFLTALVFLYALCPSLSAAPPNVLLIITDDQGYGDFSIHGNRTCKRRTSTSWAHMACSLSASM
jgi:hypothetical protein